MRQRPRLCRMTALLVVWGVLAMVCAQSPEAEVPAAGRTGEALPANVELNGRYFREYLTDTGAMLASPLHWTGTEWMKAALVAGTAVSLYSVDGDVKREVQKNRTSWSDDTARGARLFGESAYTLPALGAFYLYGEFREDRSVLNELYERTYPRNASKIYSKVSNHVNIKFNHY